MRVLDGSQRTVTDGRILTLSNTCIAESVDFLYVRSILNHGSHQTTRGGSSRSLRDYGRLFGVCRSQKRASRGNQNAQDYSPLAAAIGLFRQCFDLIPRKNHVISERPVRLVGTLKNQLLAD